MRASCVVLLASVLVPAMASAQSAAPSVSIQGGAGPTLVDTGHHLSAAVGFSPTPRVTLLLDVERTHLSSRTTGNERGGSSFRGGTLTAVSGEVRVGLWLGERVTPYVLAGLGAGMSRPNVNEVFPDRVTNNVRFVFFGGGIQVPLRDRLSLFGDARMQVGVEANETLAMAPVRVGLAWRF
jgi:hypothetical protein